LRIIAINLSTVICIYIFFLTHHSLDILVEQSIGCFNMYLQIASYTAVLCSIYFFYGHRKMRVIHTVHDDAATPAVWQTVRRVILSRSQIQIIRLVSISCTVEFLHASICAVCWQHLAQILNTVDLIYIHNSHGELYKYNRKYETDAKNNWLRSLESAFSTYYAVL